MCVHQPVTRERLCVYVRGFSFLFYLFSPVEEFSEAVAAGPAGGGCGREKNMKRSLVHSLFSLSLFSSLSRVCFVFLRERSRLEGRVR